MDRSAAVEGRRSQLLRVLGAGFTLAVVVGGTIGVGILRVPAAVAGNAGSPVAAMLLWLAGGLFALLGASIFAELATSVPRSGGTYVYARAGMGDGAGFLFGCADILTVCSAIAFASLAVIEFTGLLLPAIAPWQTPLAAALVAGFAASQLGGVRFSSVVQQVMTAVKALAFIALVAGLLLFADPVAEAPARTTAGAAPMGLVGIVLGLQLVVLANDGWSTGSYFAGESVASARVMARAMLGGVLVVIAVYLSLNLALFRVLPFDALVASPLPVAEAARVWLGERGAQVVTAIAALSLLPLLGVALMVATRVVHAMASDALLPGSLARVDVLGTPVRALFAITCTAVLLILASGGLLNTMLGIGALYAVFSYIGGFVALLRLRTTQPDLPRPYRAPGYPVNAWVALAGAIGLTVGIVVSSPRDSLLAITVLVLAFPLYRLRRRFI